MVHLTSERRGEVGCTGQSQQGPEVSHCQIFLVTPLSLSFSFDLPSQEAEGTGNPGALPHFLREEAAVSLDWLEPT